MSLLKQDIAKKGQVDKKTCQFKFESNDNNNKNYKIKKICNNMIYIKKLERSCLPSLFHLVL